MRTLAALAALALGCSPTAGPPIDDDAGARLYDTPIAFARDGTGDGLTSTTPDVQRGDGPAECRDPYIRCNDGSCILQSGYNCGACGRACGDGLTCCVNGFFSRCSYNCENP